jgi:hypothetical protein
MMKEPQDPGLSVAPMTATDPGFRKISRSCPLPRSSSSNAFSSPAQECSPEKESQFEENLYTKDPWADISFMRNGPPRILWKTLGTNQSIEDEKSLIGHKTGRFRRKAMT